jgi:FixJ family two-component response regulator
MRFGTSFEHMSEEATVSQVPLVIFIDDDESVCEAMAGFLKAFGFGVETFLSAEEFLKSNRMEKTACLITDVQLGGMSGLELQSRLIALGCRFPIIFITAFFDETIRRRALSSGALGFLGKPVPQDELLACVRSAVENR